VTSYDVDIHEARTGDTYESISRDTYNDVRYATALRTYNKNQPIKPGAPIDVPPIHILRKLSGQTTTTGTPSLPPGQAGASTDTGGWSAAGGSGNATFRPGTVRTYTVPTGGTTLPEIARQLLGSEKRWKEISNLNPDVLPGVIPEGTTLKLPADAVVPR